MMIRAVQLPTDHPVVKNVDARLRNVLKLLDSRLEHAAWLAGDEFTAADIMSVFSLTTVRMFMPFDLSGYPEILRYLGRGAMAKGDPGFTPILGGPAPELFPATKLSIEVERNLRNMQIWKAEIHLILYMP
jgi:glutathione S-transferase